MSNPPVLDFRAFPVDAPPLAPVLDHLRQGGLLVYPTETVYGFGGLETPDIVHKLSAMKSRDAEKPLLLLIPDERSARDLAWTPAARELAEVFWPGAVTLVLSDPETRHHPGVRGPAGGVAVRVSPHPLVRALVEGLDAPLLSTSANRPGEPPALAADEALEAARSLGAWDDLWVLDGGDLPPSAPSTIVDCTSPEPLVIREGSIPLGRVRCVLPDIQAASRE